MSDGRDNLPQGCPECDSQRVRTTNAQVPDERKPIACFDCGWLADDQSEVATNA